MSDYLSVPHFGVSRHELTVEQIAERRAAVRDLDAEQLALYRRESGRILARQGHAARQEQRIAAGLPRTRREELRRKPDRIADPTVEAWWIEKAQAAGLANGLERDALRRLAARLAGDAAAEEARRLQTDGPEAPPLDDDDLLIAHYRAEADRWHTRAIRDRAMADEHQRLAEVAEQALANLLYKLGRIS